MYLCGLEQVELKSNTHTNNNIILYSYARTFIYWVCITPVHRSSFFLGNFIGTQHTCYSNNIILLRLTTLGDVYDLYTSLHCTAVRLHVTSGTAHRVLFIMATPRHTVTCFIHNCGVTLKTHNITSFSRMIICRTTTMFGKKLLIRFDRWRVDWVAVQSIAGNTYYRVDAAAGFLTSITFLFLYSSYSKLIWRYIIRICIPTAV